MVESDVLDYILIKSLYQRIHMRMIAEDVVLYMLANPHIKAQYENEKVYDVARNIQIYSTMEMTSSNYASSADFTDFFLSLKLKSNAVIAFPQDILDCFHPDNIFVRKYHKRLCKYYRSKYSKDKSDQFIELYGDNDEE